VSWSQGGQHEFVEDMRWRDEASRHESKQDWIDLFTRHVAPFLVVGFPCPAFLPGIAGQEPGEDGMLRRVFDEFDYFW
jgi:hypothetical protein